MATNQNTQHISDGRVDETSKGWYTGGGGSRDFYWTCPGVPAGKKKRVESGGLLNVAGVLHHLQSTLGVGSRIWAAIHKRAGCIQHHSNGSPTQRSLQARHWQNYLSPHSAPRAHHTCAPVVASWTERRPRRMIVGAVDINLAVEDHGEEWQVKR